jgi:hypothetical protein
VTNPFRRLIAWLFPPPPRRPCVPIRYAGKWIAWAADGVTIVASGDSPQDCMAAARRDGGDDVIYEYVPRPGEFRPMMLDDHLATQPHTRRTVAERTEALIAKRIIDRDGEILVRMPSLAGDHEPPTTG